MFCKEELAQVGARSLDWVLAPITQGGKGRHGWMKNKAELPPGLCLMCSGPRPGLICTLEASTLLYPNNQSFPVVTPQGSSLEPSCPSPFPWGRLHKFSQCGSDRQLKTRSTRSQKWEGTCPSEQSEPAAVSTHDVTCETLSLILWQSSSW